MNALQKTADEAALPLITDRQKLAKIKVVKNATHPFVVCSKRTGSRLAAFTQRGNAEAFIENVALDVLQHCA